MVQLAESAASAESHHAGSGQVPPDVIDEIVKILEETSGTSTPASWRRQRFLAARPRQRAHAPLGHTEQGATSSSRTR